MDSAKLITTIPLPPVKEKRVGEATDFVQPARHGWEYQRDV